MYLKSANIKCSPINIVNENSKKIKNYLNDFEFFLQDGQINEFVVHPHAIHWVVFPNCFVLSEL